MLTSHPLACIEALVRVLLFNKPFRVLCQFTDEEGRDTLATFLDAPGCYAAGRLDYDSEGLLVLTDDGRLKGRISEPRYKLPKTYFVQVEGEPQPQALEGLRDGVVLRDGPAKAREVELVDEPGWLWARRPPIRFRKSVPTSWLRMTLTEGRNRQVRRMSAAVGHPTLRLIRWSVGPWELGKLKPGQSRELSGSERALPNK